MSGLARFSPALAHEDLLDMEIYMQSSPNVTRKMAKDFRVLVNEYQALRLRWYLGVTQAGGTESHEFFVTYADGSRSGQPLLPND